VVLVRLMWKVVSVTSVASAALLAPVTLTGAGSNAVPSAAAAPCPQVEVIFARGRIEPPGTGLVGNAFVSALRSKTTKSLDYYAVDYLADIDVVQGANDMSRRIQYMAANCPNTRLVIGGYSLGAAVTDVVLAIPSPVFGYTNPLPLGMDDHIAAVALFGNGTQKVFGPVAEVIPKWGGKTIDLCTADDPICNDNMDPETWVANWSSHLQGAYIDSGLVDQAAAFAAARI
jgi:cutinase